MAFPNLSLLPSQLKTVFRHTYYDEPCVSVLIIQKASNASKLSFCIINSFNSREHPELAVQGKLPDVGGSIDLGEVVSF
jgi:hypothetical protein